MCTLTRICKWRVQCNISEICHIKIFKQNVSWESIKINTVGWKASHLYFLGWLCFKINATLNYLFFLAEDESVCTLWLGLWSEDTTLTLLWFSLPMQLPLRPHNKTSFTGVFESHFLVGSKLTQAGGAPWSIPSSPEHAEVQNPPLTHGRCKYTTQPCAENWTLDSCRHSLGIFPTRIPEGAVILGVVLWLPLWWLFFRPKCCSSLHWKRHEQ